MQRYTVTVERRDARHAEAAVRAFRLTLGARRADLEAGFNPVETLLAALGDCLLTSLDLVAGLSRIPLDAVRIEVSGERQDRPPTLTAVRYRLFARTPVPAERFGRLVALAERNSTVFQTLSRAVPVTGEWACRDPGTG
ncbi:OsmC-like protein [Candidatus Hydrogenisulfobacillus filiaventi]|uniref:OsmC-like protein n=1 Tax=Candidatus Hydrogenisulfobacillus filiaventi TaxID=2707344 RepID=A0A6F8ZCR9_9FIRM|nr:OsmC-like protein [Candidatus Hydrogenisulfobacillus filiaventi]